MMSQRPVDSFITHVSGEMIGKFISKPPSQPYIAVLFLREGVGLTRIPEIRAFLDSQTLESIQHFSLGRTKGTEVAHNCCQTFLLGTFPLQSRKVGCINGRCWCISICGQLQVTQ